MDLNVKRYTVNLFIWGIYLTVFSSDFFVDSYLQFPDKTVWISISSEKCTAVSSVDLRLARGGSARYQNSQAIEKEINLSNICKTTSGSV